MYYKIVSYFIFISSLIVLIFVFSNILEDDNNVYKLYTYTLEGELFVLVYYMLYCVGSVLNLKSRNNGSSILLFASIGFILAALGDYVFIGSYGLFIYVLYIILHSIVFTVINKRIIWKTILVFCILNIALIYTMVLIFNVQLLI